MPLYTLTQTLTIGAFGILIGLCLGAAWAAWLVERRLLREIEESLNSPLRTAPFTDLAGELLDEDDLDLIEEAVERNRWSVEPVEGRWTMDLTDYHPADRLLDPVEMAKDTTTVVDFPGHGEPREIDVPHEPPASDRGLS